MAINMKRKRISGPMRMNRRRIGGVFSGTKRAPLRSRRRRAPTVSAQRGNVAGIGFRSRRMRRITWRRLLWNQTLFKPHFRSVVDASNTIPAPVSVDAARLDSTFALAANFWTAAGGLQSIDNGVPVPGAFVGDIVLRGGLSRLLLSNNATVDSVRVRVFTVWTNKNPDLSIVPAVGSAVQISWDPSLVPDFERFGKVLKSQEFILLPGQRPIEITYRHKIRKVDQAIHNLGGEQMIWIITTSQCSNVDGGTQAVTISNGYNISLCGDAV